MATQPGFLFLLGTCLAVIEGEIRCYCNESGCINTGYMCKSNIGQCYTAVRFDGERTRSTHGCADTLSNNLDLCTKGQKLVKSTDESQVPFLMCCHDDMCNYIDNIDINIILNTNSNDSAQKGETQINDRPLKHDVFYARNEDAKEPERDLWFKAAVIAVPIAGGFILVLLVLLAVRMLRTDTRRHSRLIQIRREHSLKKAQLYVTDHFSDKAGKHCSLFSDRHKTKTDSHGRIYKPIPETKNIVTPSTQIVTPQSTVVTQNPSIVTLTGIPPKHDLATVV
ncbi:hypothetical protein LOTGIDRAFT_151562 [Lottia gigantea]|uniref:BMP and activin membrane-bound inhibitor homolog n=1 Tax=Lottia gigantea TaxID=225164 RepID=V4AXA9_LOTGI|nr:hypothetical protein LOTGIDRAFT_151562 [Lottia gigantea]ESO99695.1 hypothetical protein LOTGIDRAFT_151562 [Lottia gigantea]